MIKPKLLLIGYRAYGDWLYALPALPQLFEQYDVYLETNPKGFELFHDDPRFAYVSMFDYTKHPQEEWEQRTQERWKAVTEQIQPDRIINLWRTLETACIAERYQEEFFAPVAERRKLFGDKVFYDVVAERCEGDVGPLDSMFFTEDQEAWAKRWRKKEGDNFVLLMVVAGTCPHKVYPYMPSLARGLVERYENLRIYLMGDPSTAHLSFDHPRISNISGQPAMKQSILMTKHADFVFGGETGLLVAAGMFGTPKMMLCTASSVKQCCSYQDNDYSVQSAAECSPCHRSVYCDKDCEGVVELENDVWHPACINGFDHKHIFDTIGIQYEMHSMS